MLQMCRSAKRREKNHFPLPLLLLLLISWSPDAWLSLFLFWRPEAASDVMWIACVRRETDRQTDRRLRGSGVGKRKKKNAKIHVCCCCWSWSLGQHKRISFYFFFQTFNCLIFSHLTDLISDPKRDDSSLLLSFILFSSTDHHHHHPISFILNLEFKTDCAIYCSIIETLTWLWYAISWSNEFRHYVSHVCFRCTTSPYLFRWLFLLPVEVCCVCLPSCLFKGTEFSSPFLIRIPGSPDSRIR